MIDKRKFDKVFLEAVDQLRKSRLTPENTGNLKYNAIKYKWNSPTQFEIYVDVGDTQAFVSGQKFLGGTAPYMPFTNETWISPRWNGKKNPHENWWNKEMELLIKFIAKRLKGQLWRPLNEKEIKELGEM